MRPGAKVLFVDIETAPILMTSWSMQPPHAGAIWVERDTFILMFSYKWADERAVKTVCLPDFPRYRRNRYDDKALCGVLHRLLDDADIVVAHNGDAFDIKKINSRLIVNGFGKPSPFKTIDTLKIARRAFKFDSSKLDNIGRYLNEGRKIPNTGAALWRGCVEGDPRAWRTMRGCGKQDTALLERLIDARPQHQGVSSSSPKRATRVYVAGPMTGKPDLNRPAFARAANRLRIKGYQVYNPAATALDGSPLPFIMAHVLPQLCECQAIAMLPGWWRSGGARIEWLLAKYLKLKIIYL